MTKLHRHYTPDDDEPAPLNFDKKTPVRMPLGVLITVIVAAAISGGEWLMLRNDVAEHTAQIAILMGKLDAQHDLLLAVSADVKGLRRDEERQPLAAMSRPAER